MDQFPKIRYFVTVVFFSIKLLFGVQFRTFWIRLPEKNSIMFKIKTIPKCPKRILQSYQADEVLSFDATKRFEVKTKEKLFSNSIYLFLQTDHLVDQLIGKPEIQPKSS